MFERGPDGKLHPKPGWHTTGPFAFKEWSRAIDWPGVASDLGEIALGAATFLQGGAVGTGIFDGLGVKIGPHVIRGIVEGHHSLPRFLGGPSLQALAKLHQSLHRMFHDDLAKALSAAGFPRIGGRGGGRLDWLEYFAKNSGKREEAIDILIRTTRDFDRRNGTKIMRHLEEALK